MNENRADSFLRLIRRMQRGKLKIYLGYAAGVGKTYQMLLEAHRLGEDGIDAAVGIVETHGRRETETLVAGLDVLPRRKIVYRGIEIEELDIDRVLSRRPEVVLIDELAHTNVPGSRNAKRYQDVEEILAAGIHVISTLNIQHLESLYDMVERATGVKVRERIPDYIVAGADQVVNVDITAEDLRRRLTEGKVYTSERIDTALAHFFKAANLESLRELTLRELAAQIDSKTRKPFSEESPNPDQVMVCLSSRSPRSEALLRYASRLAGKLNRNWYAVYVQTSREAPACIDAPTQRLLSNTLTLAQQLGATVFTYRGDDVVKTILQFAKEYRVGHIVIGASDEKPSFFQRIIGKTGVAERLIAESPGINIVVLCTRTPTRNPISEEFPSTDEPPPSHSPEQQVAVPDKSTVFKNTRVLIWKDAIEKETAIQDLLVACCGEQPGLRAPAWEALLARERQGGTFVGEDVAIPHARISGIDHPLLAFGVSRSGIYDNVSGLTARLMVLLLSPADSHGSHVKMLGMISGMVRDDQWRKGVLSVTTSSEILTMIRRWGENHRE